MSVADMARAAAVHCEGKWHALRRDNKTGDWLMTFTIATTDFPALVRDASPGQRFMLALVAIDSDEMPINGGEDGPVATTSQPDDGDAASPAAAPARKRWRELSRAQRAGMLCEDAEFRYWLFKTFDVHLKPDASVEDAAAEVVRSICLVASRSQLDQHKHAGEKWDALETRFMQETGRMAVDR